MYMKQKKNMNDISNLDKKFKKKQKNLKFKKKNYNKRKFYKKKIK